jgi:hypothetical protein
MHEQELSEHESDVYSGELSEYQAGIICLLNNQEHDECRTPPSRILCLSPGISINTCPR